ARRLDEVDAVVVVLLDAGGDREDVRVEDDVFRREADFLGQDAIGSRTDSGLALERVGLPLLVERHDDDGGAVAADLFGVLAGEVERRGVITVREQLAEARRPGDVGAFADIDEGGGSGCRHQASSNASRPESRIVAASFGRSRGGTPSTAAAMALIWSGVVPQQPPTILTRPARANSPSIPAIASGLSSYSPNSLGSPALG